MSPSLRNTVKRLFQGRAFERRMALEVPKLWHIPEANLAFIHVPKVATRTIRNCLARQLFEMRGEEPPELSMQAVERIARDYARFTPIEEIAALPQECLIFAFVRNPLERLYSCYKNKVLGPVGKPDGVNLFWAYGIELGIGFPEFVERVARVPDRIADRHLRSQHRFLYHGEQLVPRFLGRFERFEEDWEDLRARTSLPGLGVHENRSPRTGTSWQGAYRPHLARLAAERYATDIERFGYADALAPLLNPA